MKIIFVSAWYPPNTKGGAELSAHFLAQGLRQRGHEVSIITDGDTAESSDVDGLAVRRVPMGLTSKPLFEHRHSRRAAMRLKPILNELGEYDVIHAHDFRSALALAELALPRSVVTVRDYAQICGSTNNYSVDGGRCPGCTWRDVWHNHRVAEAAWPRKLFRAWQYVHNIAYRGEAFQRFPYQIYISYAQLAEIARQHNLSRQKTHVIYNPIAPEYVAVPPVLGKRENLLYVGTVEDYKGVGLLLKAFKALRATFSALTLTIVGDGNQRKEYEKQVSAAGLQDRVFFKGRIPYAQLREQYDQAGIVVAPHRWIEPFGRTVVEGMARGKIVVAADSGGPAEIITHQVTGLLFKPGNVSSLRQTVTQALELSSNTADAIQRAARDWVQSNLVPELIAAQYEAVYQQVKTD